MNAAGWRGEQQTTKARRFDQLLCQIIRRQQACYSLRTTGDDFNPGPEQCHLLFVCLRN